MHPSKDYPALTDPVTLRYNYTGAETVNFSPRLQQQVRSTVSWKEKTMIVTNNLGEEQDWSLLGDEKILTIAFIHNGRDTSTCFFDKTK